MLCLYLKIVVGLYFSEHNFKMNTKRKVIQLNLTVVRLSYVLSCRLIESPYKVVLEQLVALEPPAAKTREEEEDKESQAVLQRPLEICLKHSTVSTTDASDCPLVRPQPGVAALHEYAEWITELKDKQGDADCK